jgi:hypothetical protein
MATNATVSTCCPFTLAEGCTTTGGRWVAIRNADGTVSIIDPTDGSAVPPANVLDFCPAGESQSHINTLAASSVFVIPAANLESWAVRARGTTVTIDINAGGANAMDDNEVITSSAQDDDLLSDTVTVTTGAGSTARISWITRL